MPDTPKNDYVCGGYYLARLSERAEYMSPELIPDEVLSASTCICVSFPGDWAIEWTSCSAEERSKGAAAFGISPIDLPMIVAWATAVFSEAFGWPNAFYSLEAAQEARTRFFPRAAGIVTFGLGLHDSDVEGFLKAAKPPPQKQGYAPVGETGAFQCVSAGQSMAGGGHAVGFELLATYSGLLTCSWLCNGLEKVCAKELGIVTNRRGFIRSYSDALRCAEFISRDEAAAEPGLWLPWLVAIYSYST